MDELSKIEIENRVQIVAGFLNDIVLKNNIMKTNMILHYNPETHIIIGELYTIDNNNIFTIEMDDEKNIKIINKEESTNE